MLPQIILGFIIISVFLGTVLGTYFLLQVLPKLKIKPPFSLVSYPNRRSAHKKATLNIGGFGFVVVFIVSLITLFLFDFIGVVYITVLVGWGGLIAALGFWDDIKHVAIRWRLLTQILCVLIGVWSFGGGLAGDVVNPMTNLGFVSFGLAVFLLVWWLNLFNFMDGIDGLAGSEAISIAVGAIVILRMSDWSPVSGMPPEAQYVELLLLLLAAGVLGFLVFNWPPAKVFMGDVGSTFLGYTLGMIALLSIAEDIFSFWTWLILGGVFWVDSTFTLMRRMLSGERWYEAHRSHTYQRITFKLKIHFQRYVGIAPERARARAHGLTNLAILAINTLWLLPLAYASQHWPVWGLGFVIVAYFPLVLIALYVCTSSR